MAGCRSYLVQAYNKSSRLGGIDYARPYHRVARPSRESARRRSLAGSLRDVGPRRSRATRPSRDDVAWCGQRHDRRGRPLDGVPYRALTVQEPLRRCRNDERTIRRYEQAGEGMKFIHARRPHDTIYIWGEASGRAGRVRGGERRTGSVRERGERRRAAIARGRGKTCAPHRGRSARWGCRLRKQRLAGRRLRARWERVVGPLLYVSIPLTVYGGYYVAVPPFP